MSRLQEGLFVDSENGDNCLCGNGPDAPTWSVAKYTRAARQLWRSRRSLPSTDVWLSMDGSSMSSGATSRPRWPATDRLVVAGQIDSAHAAHAARDRSADQ